MPALNFKKRFASAVLEGRKTQTIRATRKIPVKVGDKLYLYTGMRTKQCQRLRVTKCTRVAEIQIREAQVWVDGEWLPLDELKAMARADGFQDAWEFTEFFRTNHGFPFIGQLIGWNA